MENFTNSSNDIFFYHGNESDTFMKNYPAETLGDLLQFCNANIGSINLQNLQDICCNNNLFFFRFKRHTLRFITAKTAWEHEPC